MSHPVLELYDNSKGMRHLCFRLCTHAHTIFGILGQPLRPVFHQVSRNVNFRSIRIPQPPGSIPKTMMNRSLLKQTRRCLVRKLHAGQSLGAKQQPPPRFQKPGSLPKVVPSVDSKKLVADVEATGAPRPSIPAAVYEAHNRAPPPSPPSPPRIADTSSKEYKQAERKWLSVIVALPILFVTSYFLFDRRKCKPWRGILMLPMLTGSGVALGHVPPTLPHAAPSQGKEAVHEPKPKRIA